MATACGAATLVNIYGLKFWAYLISALLNRRPNIAEWQPLPLFADDIFNSFRILFVLLALVLIAGWRRVKTKNWPGLVMLAITAILAWRSRRHAPFFGVTALAFAGAFLQATLAALFSRLHRAQNICRSAFAVAVLYGVIVLAVATVSLPRASLDVLAPVGHDPVREADILSRAQIAGNLATPFGWGCYCSWRLYPRIKISMDGRYETTFPESTFELNNAFYRKRGANWDQLLRDYPVDFVILDFTEGALRPADMIARGYVLIWQTGEDSALLALPQHAEKLRRAAAELPPTTINPLDAKIPDAWWPR